jgi:copper homeostasis protein
MVPFTNIPLVESCCTTLGDAIESAAAGAGRIEFCADLDCGGLTPDHLVVAEVVRRLQIPVFVLVRPRAGDFVYTAAEFAAIQRAIDEMRSAGAKGVVLGVLDGRGRVDVARTGRLVSRAQGLSVTFHKAFDQVPDLDRAFLACRQAGIHRILSSGGAATALGGAAVLRRLVLRRQAMSDGPDMMAGGSVRADHARRLVTQTGVSEIHARAEAIPSLMRALAVPDGQSDATR